MRDECRCPQCMGMAPPEPMPLCLGCGKNTLEYYGPLCPACADNTTACLNPDGINFPMLAEASFRKFLSGRF